MRSNAVGLVVKSDLLGEQRRDAQLAAGREYLTCKFFLGEVAAVLRDV